MEMRERNECGEPRAKARPVIEREITSKTCESGREIEGMCGSAAELATCIWVTGEKK